MLDSAFYEALNARCDMEHSRRCQAARDYRELLDSLVADGTLLYVYTNGFVLPNVPDIQGGILNNNAARDAWVWLSENGYLSEAD